MIKLAIKNADGSHYWTEHFNDAIDAKKWLDVEMTRPYWKPGRTAEYFDDGDPLTFVNGVPTLDPAVKAAREKKKADEALAEKAKADARKPKLDAIKALKDQPKNAVNRNTFLDNLMDLVFEEGVDAFLDQLKHKVK